MVPTFVKMEEPNIAALWREEETTVVSHFPIPEPTGGDKEEPSVFYWCQNYEGQHSRWRSGSNSYHCHKPLDHLDMISRCMDGIRHVENQQARIIQLLKARQEMESKHEEEDSSTYIFQR